MGEGSQQVPPQGDRGRNDGGCLPYEHHAKLETFKDGSDGASTDGIALLRTSENLLDIQMPVGVGERRPGTFDGKS